MSAIFISHSSKDNAEAHAMSAWLKKQGHTSYFIDYDEKSGISAGSDWEQVLYQRLRRCQAIIVLVTPDWLESKWCFAEMIQAREKGKPIFPVIAKPCQLPDLLSDTQKIDLIADPDGGHTRLALGLKENGLDPADVFDWDPMRPPYPGLPSFEEEDAAVFFGRGSDILEACEALEGLRRHNRDVSRFVLFLGSSGSGKSSLVRAGLIPRLKKDKDNWLPLKPFRPQDETNPVDALAFAFANTYKVLGFPCDSDLVRDRLSRAAASPATCGGELLAIARELASAAGRCNATVLITVDQAEEFFGSEPPETGKAFLQFLGASLAAGDRHLMAIATLRSDFLGIFQDQVALLDPPYRLGLNHLPITVEPISVERYSDLVERPANLASIVLEGNLVQRLLQDTRQRDSLPLLAFTLRRLYDLHFEGPRADRCAKLTVHEYEKLGGVAGAVQNAADRIVKELQPAEDEVAALRDAFIPGLVRTNDEGSYFRRRAFLDELPFEAQSLLKRFISARLLVAGENGRATVEIAHEALLRTWSILTTWLDKDRDKLRQHNAIVRAAQEWKLRRAEAYLVHRDGRLEDAKKLVFEPRFEFSAGSVERDYLDACEENQSKRDTAAQEERERRVKDAEQLAHAESTRAKEAEEFARAQKKAASKLRRLVGILAAVALAAAAAVIFGYWQTTVALRAQQEKIQAASQDHVSLARRSKESGNNARALAHLAQALQLNYKNVEAAALIGAMLAQKSWALSIAGPIRHISVTDSAQFSPDYQRVLTSLFDKTTALGNATIGKHDALVRSAQFGPECQRVVTASMDNTARLWDVATGEPIGESMKHDGPVDSAQFSPDGRRVVTTSLDRARLWDAATGKPIGESMKHDGPVGSAAFSPDGREVVTTSEDHTARLWDAATGKPIGEPMRHLGIVFSALFSPDSQRVVTASLDKTATLWDAATGKSIGESMKHDGPVRSAAFSPDGREVVTTSVDNTARFWDAATGEPIGEPMRHEGDVAFALFSPDSQRVVTVSGEKTARLWDAATGKPIGEPMRHEGTIKSAQFSPDGQRVVTASSDKKVRLWDAATGKAIAEPIEHESGVLSAEFSPDGQHVVTAANDNTLRKYDASPSKPMNEPMKHEYGVSSAQFSPNGQRLVTTSLDGTARLWDAATGKAIGEPMRHEDRVFSAQFSPDGQRVVTASGDRSAKLWDAATGKAIGEPMKHEDRVFSAQFSPDGQRVVTASKDHTARLWNAASGKAVGAPLRHEDRVFSAQFSPDGQRVVTASLDKFARLWNSATGEPIGESMKHDGPVNSAAFSPDGQRVVTSSDRTTRLWDGKTGKPIGDPMQHNNVVTSAQFSPDGRRVVTASSDKTARLWDGKTGKPIGDPMQHNNVVTSAQFSPDGRRVVTASSDKTARLWDGKTGKPIGDPMQHNNVVTSAQFSPDGQRIVTASMDKLARLWDIPTVSVKDTAEDVLLLADVAEAMAGVKLPASGQMDEFQVLSATEVSTTREKIYAKLGTKSSELTPLQHYLKWSLMAKRSRTISPFSRTTFVEWINRTIDEGTLDDLRAAMEADPANPRLAAQFGRRLADRALDERTDPTKARQARAEADFQTRRAVKLAPGNAEIIKLRAEVAKLLQLGAQ